MQTSLLDKWQSKITLTLLCTQCDLCNMEFFVPALKRKLEIALTAFLLDELSTLNFFRGL